MVVSDVLTTPGGLERGQPRADACGADNLFGSLSGKVIRGGLQGVA